MLVSKNYYLNKVCRTPSTHLLVLSRIYANHFFQTQAAKDGYRSYLQAYASHSLRSVFNVQQLDLKKVAKSFGFATPPRVDIQLGAGMKKPEGRRAYGSQPRQHGGRGGKFQRR
jgi:ATP-dependent RNA helicase DDX18/HAS1